MKMTRKQLTEILDNYGVEYHFMSVGSSDIAITKRCGRIMGPFTEDGENLFWINKALSTDEAEKYLTGDLWNIGGERLWFGPEIVYSVSDRTRFWETLNTPAAIDPGDHTITVKEDSICVERSFDVDRMDIPAKKAHVDLKRIIRKAPNPLRNLPEYDKLMKEAEYSGYEHEIIASGYGEEIEPWDLLQVNPGGKIYIPMFSPMHGVDYYEPVGSLEKVEEKGVLLEATGKNRYKVGYPAATVMDRIAYITKWDGCACLIIRCFPNNPSATYNEEPSHSIGSKGFSIHVYNDDAGENGFSELECSLPGFGGDTEKTNSHHSITNWIFKGSDSSISNISKILLGRDLIKS